VSGGFSLTTLVRTAKSLVDYPGKLATPLDHFKCY
jgi:hypothetical protein